LRFRCSFKSIDPTPCHQSAHPLQHDSTIAFAIVDTASEDASTVTISEITTRHIRALASSASDFIGEKVNAAVITIPTNFSQAQKDALVGAAKQADVEVLQLIHEPVAAVLAYDARSGSDLGDKIVVVVDLGGTRSDVAVVASRGGIYTILATAHDYDVSGSKLDEVLIDHFAKEFLKKNKDVGDPRKNARSLAKLTLECESVKKALSLGASANFSVESLSGGIDFTATINRTRYELLATKIFGAFTRLVLDAVQKAKLDPLDISEIILAGGTSHTPRITRNIQGAFPEHVTVWAPATAPEAINPSELASRGAAIQASLIVDFDVEDVRESCHAVVTATPHLSAAVGVLCVSADAPPEGHGMFHPLIEAETPVPVRRSKIFTVPGAGGNVLVKLCEASSSVVTKPVEKKASTNGNKKATVEDDDDDSDDEDESEEEEDTKERKWNVGRVLAEAAIRDVAKGGKVEVQVNVAPDLAVTVVARAVGAKGGVRGVLPAHA
jgi:molecular chaperone DnaK (HSP70)